MPWLPRLPQAPAHNRPLRQLVAQLPLRALLPLIAAIFFQFAVLGPVTDILDGGRHGTGTMIRNAVASGAMAAGFAFGSLRRNRPVIAIMIAGSLLWTALAGRSPVPLEQDAAALHARLTVDAIATLALTMISYGCFLWFSNVTAARYLRVRAEIELAHDIHTVLVPPVAKTTGGFEFFGVSHPSGEVGGDLIDVVDTGDGWFAYVADVSGHGVSSGVVMGMFKSALRMRLRSAGAMDALLGDLNTVLVPLKSSAMYVTLACVRPVAGGLEYAVAGHLPILRVRDGQVVEATTPQIPIGMFEDYAFASAATDVAPGDLLALITDGLVEVFDAKDRELGLDAVKALLAGTAGRPLAEIADALRAAAHAHGKQLDDQSVLLIRRL
jgi:sigma-B regulation protein RsbU (phosphoserine phosphatase)